MQDIFVDFWRYASRYDAARGPEAAFVAILARRRLIDRIRRQKLRFATEEPLEETHEATIPGALRTEHDTEMDSMRSVMAHLTLPQRRVLELSLVQGMSHAENCRAHRPAARHGKDADPTRNPPCARIRCEDR